MPLAPSIITARSLTKLIRFLRLRFVGGEDAFLLEGIFRSEVWNFMDEPISQANEAAVNGALATRCPCLRLVYTVVPPNISLFSG